jgi:formate hydrogenlyase subunit 3/multisubunit Na+/H+ antiporter MnhD subunit
MIEVWLLAVGLPGALALMMLARGWARSTGVRLAPIAALPALALSIATATGDEVSVPWLLLGAFFGLDTTGQVFLFFTAVVWTLAAVYARAYLEHDDGRHRFYFFFLLTMSGNLGLIVARDVASFYLFFALMTFSAYGLVIYERGTNALRAGRIYIAMAIVGEACLLAGLLLASQAAGTLYLPELPAAVAASPARDLIVGLLLVGFGVKAGSLPLHVWLPLAHPVAPTPASAVLSGCMIKAGLLGWLRFLPLGEATMPEWGGIAIIAGLAAAFFGVVVGVTQIDPKTNLAYSSISQMGIINTAVGVGLAVPEAWPVVLPAIQVYALHHALAKGALFLGVGVAQANRDIPWQRWLIVGGLLLCALALAGAPLTSGAVAKDLFKAGAALAPVPWPLWLDALLPLTSVGTGLLMGRFLLLTLTERAVGAHHPLGPAAWGAWAVLLVGVAFTIWLLPAYYELDVVQPPRLLPSYLWASFWPLLLAALILFGVRHARRRLRARANVVITAGDILIPVERALGGAHRRWQMRASSESARAANDLADSWHDTVRRGTGGDLLASLERGLTRWETAGTLILLLVVAMLAALYLAPVQAAG